MSTPLAPRSKPYATVVCLTQGYVVSFGGQEIAAPTAQAAGQIVAQMLLDYQTAWTATPVRQQAPVPAQIAQMPAAPLQTPRPLGEPPVSSRDPREDKNLSLLVTARMDGTIGDAEFYAKAREYCPSYADVEIMDALDGAFVGPENLDREPPPNLVRQGAGVSAPSTLPLPEAGSLVGEYNGAPVYQGAAPSYRTEAKPSPGTAWGIQIDDYVVDHETGQRLGDG